MVFSLSFTHLLASIVFNLSFNACSKVADKLMLSALVLFSKSLFMLRFVAFFVRQHRIMLA